MNYMKDKQLTVRISQAASSGYWLRLLNDSMTSLRVIHLFTDVNWLKLIFRFNGKHDESISIEMIGKGNG